jgi:hypothetical protein
MDKPMTLAAKKLYGLAKVIREHGTCAPMALEHVADELDKAHLAREPVRVTDEMVERVARALCRFHSYNESAYWIEAYTPEARLAIEAVALPVAAKVPDALKLFPNASEHGVGYVKGWNDCREAMIAQGNGGVRDGLHDVEPCDEKSSPELWKAYSDFNTVYGGYNMQQALRVAINGLLSGRRAMLAAAPQPDDTEGKV